MGIALRVGVGEIQAANPDPSSLNVKILLMMTMADADISKRSPCAHPLPAQGPGRYRNALDVRCRMDLSRLHSQAPL